jgi:predicted restriction endonuclease
MQSIITHLPKSNRECGRNCWNSSTSTQIMKPCLQTRIKQAISSTLNHRVKVCELKMFPYTSLVIVDGASKHGKNNQNPNMK